MAILALVMAATAPAWFPAPPPDLPPLTTLPRAARQRGGSITSTDYPLDALRERMEGTTTVTFDIAPAGFVSSCKIAESSGHAILDAAACGTVMRNFRFEPARDAKGDAISETRNQRVTWRMPDSGVSQRLLSGANANGIGPLHMEVEFDLDPENQIVGCRVVKFPQGLPDPCLTAPKGKFPLTGVGPEKKARTVRMVQRIDVADRVVATQ